MWIWKSYITADGTLIVQNWHESVDKFVWLEFRASLEFLDGQLPANWTRPYVGTLKRDCKGLVEIRFECGNVQYRPIGYYSGKQEFTILFFAVEKGRKFVPLTACEIAQKRKDEIAQDKEKAHEFWFTKRNR